MDKTIFSKTRRTFIQASTSALLLPSAVFAEIDDYGIRGQDAPELKISQWIDGNGKPTSFKLSEHKGKFVLMLFWQAGCPGCHSHGFPAFKKTLDAFKNNKHFTAIAIQTAFESYSINTPDKMREIQKQYNLDIVVGHTAGIEEPQSNPKIMVDYRTGGTPWTVLISAEGKVLFNDFIINPEGAIALLKEEIGKMG
jgi:thiol-disulfide isomerase/thioredoxin